MNQILNPPSKKQNAARRSALNLLARRDHSCHEIRQKLKATGYSSDEIESVLTDLTQQKLIHDERFAENYIYWRSKKGYGPQRISAELQARGITPEVIAEHLNITDNAWFAEAHKVWQKHFKSKQPDNFKDRAKQMRFLQYRGFTLEQIESVFSGAHDIN